jgi:hypothetical protein
MITLKDDGVPNMSSSYYLQVNIFPVKSFMNNVQFNTTTTNPFDDPNLSFLDSSNQIKAKISDDGIITLKLPANQNLSISNIDKSQIKFVMSGGLAS